MTGSHSITGSKNLVLDEVAATLMQLDVLFYMIEKEEVQAQITLWKDEFSERFDMLAAAVFDPNTKKYKETIGMLNRSEEEINKFKDDQSRIMLLTNFLMELSNQVDTLIVGVQSSQLRN
ncbi:MAG: hypothetical protein KAW12_16490 [Candidatus Aminicenantes bacterium]|nr:hypothetical protein [Candidatus Aminicenantes bacterium]